jgi:hypothetical protein
MILNEICGTQPSFGKGEVVSSILTGSTRIKSARPTRLRRAGTACGYDEMHRYLPNTSASQS